MKRTKVQKGITLVALIITIIILLILALVALGALKRDDVLKYAKDSGLEYTIASEKEAITLSVKELQIANAQNNVDKITAQALQDKINEGKMKVTVEGEDYLTVTVVETGRLYTVDVTGSITGQVEKCNDSTPGFLEGEGTETSPYLIASIEDLVSLSNMVNGTGYTLNSKGEAVAVTEANNYEDKYVKLTIDLDFKSTASYIDSTRTDFGTTKPLMQALTTDAGFAPIGTTNDVPFKGTFEGNNKTISNLYVNINGNFAGLFGNAYTINNLTVKNGNVIGAGCCAAIAGAHRGGTITNCHNINSNITGTKIVAGIVGQATGELVEKCSNSGDINSTGNGSGGVIGVIPASANVNIKECNNSGDINGTQMVGGIAGQATGELIEKCSNTGNITASTSNAGGIVAGVASTNTNIKECNNSGKIEGTKVTGGIVGVFQGILIENCTNSGFIKISTSSGGGIVGQFKNENGNIKNCINNGEIIGGKNDSGYSMVAGIVGNFVQSNEVSNCINNAKITGDGSCVGGILGQFYTKSQTVSNCINNGEVIGKLKCVGGIVGYGSGSYNIINCHNTAPVYGGSDWTGGVLGYRVNGKIEKCSNIGDVTSDGTFVGGIAGATINIITECWNTGDIVGKKAVGGIVGTGSDSCTQDISKCYNSGTITSKGKNAGGINGELWETTCTFTQCYNKGEVNGTSGVGALIGEVQTSASLTDSYFYNAITETDAIGTGTPTTLENVKSTADDLKTYEEFIAWLENK